MEAVCFVASAANGVLQERSPGLPHAFVAGERLWGAITVAGFAYHLTGSDVRDVVSGPR